jgi:ABC-2 type transport system ATP-binding protein
MTVPPPPPPAAVSLRGVSKSFNDTPALDDLEVVAPKGRITVLLGPNGAGKTTAIRVVTGALSADQGIVETLGRDPEADGESIRAECGVVSAKPSLYDRLSGEDNLRYAAQLHEVPRHLQDDRIRAAAGRFAIDHALTLQVGGYSTGMKTRLALARSVLHEPRLLLFDEPTSGLDPESAQAVLRLIREMTTDGHTVVMCTHHLVEAEGLADHVVVLDAGTDLVAGEPSELVRHYWPEDSVEIEISGAPTPIEPIAAVAGVRAVHPTPRGVRATLDHPGITPDVVDALVRGGARVARVEPHEPTLEELYFEVRRTSRDLGEAHTDTGHTEITEIAR